MVYLKILLTTDNTHKMLQQQPSSILDALPVFQISLFLLVPPVRLPVLVTYCKHNYPVQASDLRNLLAIIL